MTTSWQREPGDAEERSRADERVTDLYAVLGVSPDAEIGELASAYRRRLRQIHPDTHRQHRVPEEAGRFVPPSLAEVLHAYAVLRDPGHRAAYDRSRAVRQPPTASGGPAAPAPGPVPIPVRHHQGNPDASRAWIRVGPVRWHRSRG